MESYSYCICKIFRLFLYNKKCQNGYLQARYFADIHFYYYLLFSFIHFILSSRSFSPNSIPGFI